MIQAVQAARRVEGQNAKSWRKDNTIHYAASHTVHITDDPSILGSTTNISNPAVDGQHMGQNYKWWMQPYDAPVGGNIIRNEGERCYESMLHRIWRRSLHMPRISPEH